MGTPETGERGLPGNCFYRGWLKGEIRMLSNSAARLGCRITVPMRGGSSSNRSDRQPTENQAVKDAGAAPD
jgi:hypothetical protein